MIVTVLPLASTAITSISGEPIMTSRCTTERFGGGVVGGDGGAGRGVAAAAPARAGGQRQPQVGAGRREPDLAQVERRQPRGALGELLGVPPPAVGRIVGAEPREAQEVAAEGLDG